MKRSSILIIGFLAIFFSSCAINVRKRLYRDGYYVSLHHTIQSRSERQTDTFSIALGETPEQTTSSGKRLNPQSFHDAMPVITDADSHRLTTGTGSCGEKINPAVGPSPAIDQPSAEVQPNESDRRTDQVRKLNATAFILLLIGILVFPTAIIMIPGAFLVSLIAFRKSKRLENNEQNRLQQKRAKNLLIVSGILLFIMVCILLVMLTITNANLMLPFFYRSCKLRH